MAAKESARRKRRLLRKRQRARRITIITRGGGLVGFAALFIFAALKIDVPQSLYFLTGGLLFGKEIAGGQLSQLIHDDDDEDGDDAA